MRAATPPFELSLARGHAAARSAQPRVRGRRPAARIASRTLTRAPAQVSMLWRELRRRAAARRSLPPPSAGAGHAQGAAQLQS